jgi:hypothetical protein
VNALGVRGPVALARALRSGPPLPTDVVRMLGNVEVELAFRELVHRLLPVDAGAILGVDSVGRDREATRAWAFCEAIERRYFPIYEYDEIYPLIYSIPFVRQGWSYDDFHDLNQRTGTLLLRAICAEPYEANLGARVPLLEAVESLGVPRDVLSRVPGDGISPHDLHQSLDGTAYAAAADFADWTWGQTNFAFLDCDDDMEVVDAEWTEENMQELKRQWQGARALTDRVSALEVWLEQNLPEHFLRLLEAALTRPINACITSEGSTNAQ